jgi:hypothetical protein
MKERKVTYDYRFRIAASKVYKQLLNATTDAAMTSRAEVILEEIAAYLPRDRFKDYYGGLDGDWSTLNIAPDTLLRARFTPALDLEVEAQVGGRRASFTLRHNEFPKPFVRKVAAEIAAL